MQLTLTNDHMDQRMAGFDVPVHWDSTTYLAMHYGIWMVQSIMLWMTCYVSVIPSADTVRDDDFTANW